MYEIAVFPAFGIFRNKSEEIERSRRKVCGFEVFWHSEKVRAARQQTI